MRHTRPDPRRYENHAAPCIRFSIRAVCAMSLAKVAAEPSWVVPAQNEIIWSGVFVLAAMVVVAFWLVRAFLSARRRRHGSSASL